MNNKRFSKDPKTILLSIEDFYRDSDYLNGIQRKLWKNEKPLKGEEYYKITPDKLILVSYGYQRVGFGFDFKEKLEFINIAYRDGVTEYRILEKYLDYLKEEHLKHKYSKKIASDIKRIEKTIRWANRHFPPFEKLQKTKNITFESCLIDTGKKFDIPKFRKKVIVIEE